MRLFGKLIRAIGTDFNRFQQDFVVPVIQRAGAFIFMIDDGFKHAIFGKFQHRLQAVNIGLVTCFEVVIQRLVGRSTHRTVHIDFKALLRLLNTALCFPDVLLHRLHFSDTASRTRVDHINTRGAQMVRAVRQPGAHFDF